MRFCYSENRNKQRVEKNRVRNTVQLTFKSPNFITHQKMKDFMTNLYLYDYEAKAETGKDDHPEINS